MSLFLEKKKSKIKNSGFGQNLTKLNTHESFIFIFKKNNKKMGTLEILTKFNIKI
jgi:hypothetical protein